MGDYRVETTAYVKLLLHAAKYPASTCTGLLVGEEQGQGFVIADAVPLFHHAAPLAPLLELACAVVDTWCHTRSPQQKIVGLYYAGSELESSALSHFAEKLADKIEANCSRACALLVDGQQLSSEAKNPVQLLLKDVKRGWMRVDNRLRVEGSGAASAAQVLSRALAQHAYRDIVDFDEHVEDVSKDWRNPHVVDLVKLNV